MESRYRKVPALKAGKNPLSNKRRLLRRQTSQRRDGAQQLSVPLLLRGNSERFNKRF